MHVILTGVAEGRADCGSTVDEGRGRASLTDDVGRGGKGDAVRISRRGDAVGRALERGPPINEGL